MRAYSVVIATFVVFCAVWGLRGRDTGDDTSGECGASAIWTFDRNSSTLTISGSGEMFSYLNYSPPWCSYRSLIQNVVIEDGVTSVGTSAFGGSTALSSVSIASSVTRIGSYAFEGCSSLKSVWIPASVDSIGSGPFTNCSGLESISVDQNSINFKSSDGVLFTKNMDEIVQFPGGRSGHYNIPDGVATLRTYSFRFSRLNSVKIPPSLTTIQNYVFNFSPLSRVDIPKNVANIGVGPFAMCSNLTSINVDSENPGYSSEDGVLFNKVKSILIQYPAGRNESNHYTIPETVFRLQRYSFSGSKYLTSVTIPPSVYSIHEFVFTESGLTSVTIPWNVSTIRTGTFSGCFNLKSVSVESPNDYFYSTDDGVLFSKTTGELLLYPARKTGSYTIPSNVTSIASYAFRGCSGLTSIIIPSNVNNIKTEVFRDCWNLRTVKYLGTNDPSGGNRTFRGCDSLSFICVPENYVNESFCSHTVLAYGNEQCNRLSEMENKCYDVVDNCYGMQIAQQKHSAEEWKHRSNGCVRYYCDNETGNNGTILCNFGGSEREICLSYQCVLYGSVKDSEYLDIAVNTSATRISLIGFDLESISDELSNISGISSESMTIGVECDAEGIIVHVFVFASRDNLQTIVSALIEYGCNFGLLCRYMSARLHEVDSLSLSQAFSAHHSAFSVTSFVIALSLLSYF